jgi:class 3 adenylate cyclase
MSVDSAQGIRKLTDAILRYSEDQPASVLQYKHGHRIIKQGDKANDCFLIREGAVSILVQSAIAAPEIQVALRFAGDLIGETAFLQQNVLRTASVVVESPKATFIRLKREDIFRILRDHPETQDSINLIYELGVSRQSETHHVIEGEIIVENRLMSALIADIHNFTALGEVVWEEQANSFLFEFMEQSEEISNKQGGIFEDQGDGFKVVFSGSDHAANAAQCAQEIVCIFKKLRSIWCEVNDAFSNIGLGIGFCSDFMSIRKRQGSPRKTGRVLGRSINIASALAKFKVTPNDVSIFVNEYAKALLKSKMFAVVERQQHYIEKLGRIAPVYELTLAADGVALHKGKRSLGDAGKGDQEESRCSVFLCHSSKDKKVVRDLSEALRRSGFKVWFDDDEILVGHDFIAKMTDGIAESDFVAIILTPNFTDGLWAQKEYRNALRRQVNEQRVVLLPVLMQDCKIPEFLSSISYADFRNSFDDGLRSLLLSLENLPVHSRRSNSDV